MLRILNVQREGSLLEIIRPQAVCVAIKEQPKDGGIICVSQDSDIYLIDHEIPDKEDKNKSSSSMVKRLKPKG